MHADGSGGFGSHEQALQVATGAGGAKSVALGGTGVLSMSDSAANFIRSATGTEAFVNGAGHTIQGAGNIGQNSLAVTIPAIPRARSPSPATTARPPVAS